MMYKIVLHTTDLVKVYSWSLVSMVGVLKQLLAIVIDRWPLIGCSLDTYFHIIYTNIEHS